MYLPCVCDYQVLKKGFPVSAMQATLKEYENLGVLYVDEDGTRIVFFDA